MIGVELTVTRPDLIDAYIQVAQDVPEFVNTITNRTINRLGPDIIRDLRKEPGSVKTPIKWTSEKQRRYVMAMKRKGVIPTPYVRTHGVSQGWKVAVIYRPGEMSSIQITNDDPATPFVEGRWQQGFHRATGWLNASDAITPWLDVLHDEIETDILKAWEAVGEGVR